MRHSRTVVAILILSLTLTVFAYVSGPSYLTAVNGGRYTDRLGRQRSQVFLYMSGVTGLPKDCWVKEYLVDVEDGGNGNVVNTVYMRSGQAVTGLRPGHYYYFRVFTRYTNGNYIGTGGYRGVWFNVP